MPSSTPPRDQPAVARWRQDPSGIVVLGTSSAHEACQAAGISPGSHQWGGSYFYPAGGSCTATAPRPVHTPMRARPLAGGPQSCSPGP